jgi:hypothetical protein
MKFEDLKTIEGVGGKTIDKLEQSGYIIEDLKDVNVEELAEIGIENSIATKILSFVESDEDSSDNSKNDSVLNKENSPDVSDESKEALEHIGLDYDINKASESLIDLFKESDEYNEVNEEQSEAIQYDKWRRNLNKKRLMNNY